MLATAVPEEGLTADIFPPASQLHLTLVMLKARAPLLRGLTCCGRWPFAGMPVLSQRSARSRSRYSTLRPCSGWQLPTESLRERAMAVMARLS